MPLQVRRGTDAERLAMTQPLATGELLYVTNEQKLYVGDGATLGGIQITGYTDGDAKDSAAEILTDGVHTGIGFAYNTATDVITATVDLSNYAGTIKADAFKGSVFADDGSTVGGPPLVDAISGTFNGNLVGNVTGDVAGNVTGNVLGNVTGVVTGNVFTNLIDSADSSQIVVTPNVRFDADVTVENDLIVKNIVLNGVEHQTIGQELTPTAQIGEVASHYLTFVDAINVRATVKTDGDLRYTPSTGTLEADNLIAITAINSPTVNSTIVRTGEIIANNVLEITAGLTIGQTRHLVQIGSNSIDGRLRVVQNNYTNLAGVIYDQYHETADANDFRFNRGRGTSASPTIVSSGDDIADITFAAYDGVQMTRAAAISVRTSGVISNGVVPGEIVIFTYNSTGVISQAVLIDSNQRTTFSGAITPATYADAAARDLAIPTPTAGMMVYISGTGKFQGYNGSTSTWNDFN
jgi:hypothetical protein